MKTINYFAINNTKGSVVMNIFNSKRAEGNVGTAIAVVISVVLGGLILLGTIALIDGQVGPALGKTLDLQGN